LFEQLKYYNGFLHEVNARIASFYIKTSIILFGWHSKELNIEASHPGSIPSTD